MLVKDYSFFLQNLQVQVNLVVGAINLAHERHNVDSPVSCENTQDSAPTRGRKKRLQIHKQQHPATTHAQFRFKTAAKTRVSRVAERSIKVNLGVHFNWFAHEKPFILTCLCVAESFRLPQIPNPLSCIAKRSTHAKKRFKPEADCFGGASPPSPKRRAEREQVENTRDFHPKKWR
jgi:hypothetical protein